MTGRLPEPVKARILTFGEYKMGAHKVALVMRDGTVVEDVIVAWGDQIVKIGDTTNIEIDVADVVGAEDRSQL